MSDQSDHSAPQEAIPPTETCVESNQKTIVQPILGRLEKIVRQHPRRLAIKMGDRSLSYNALLPDYMVPSACVFLESFPLTNGKLDRNALPKPGERRPELSQSYVAPQNEVERTLAEIWAQILSLDRVGVHDNFFDLGGHSLAATRVVSQVIKQFRFELPLQSLFQSPPVANMAAVLHAYQDKWLDEGELERILTEVVAMSEEDAEKLGGGCQK